MNTQHFKYAVEIEKTGSITQAAENLYMAQPNLSKAIKELEEQLGITIFKRTSKGVVPTQKGEAFLVYAKKILNQIDKMESLYLPDNADRQRFSVSVPRVSYIAKAVTAFAATLDPDRELDMNILETNSMRTCQNVAEGAYRLGVIRYQLPYEGYFLDYLKEKKIAYELVWEFEYLAVMSKTHPLADDPELTYDKLRGCIEIAHGDNSVPYLPAAESGSRDKAMKRIYVYERCSQFDLLSHVPTAFMWVSPIPQEMLDRYGLVQRKLTGERIKNKDMLIYRDNYQFSELDRRFIDQLFSARNEAAFGVYR